MFSPHSRSSLGSSNSTGALGPLEPAPLPQISTLKGEGGGRDRKISLPIVSTQPIASEQGERGAGEVGEEIGAAKNIAMDLVKAVYCMYSVPFRPEHS